MVWFLMCKGEEYRGKNKNNGKKKNYKFYSSFQKFIDVHILEENFSHGAKKWKLALMVF